MLENSSDGCAGAAEHRCCCGARAPDADIQQQICAFLMHLARTTGDDGICRARLSARMPSGQDADIAEGASAVRELVL